MIHEVFIAAVNFSLVAFVVKKDGLLTKGQNLAVGWGTGIGITLVVVSLEWKNYGGEYHCWLQMNTTLMIGQYVPIVILAILTLTLIEAAGAAEYRYYRVFLNRKSNKMEIFRVKLG